VSIGLGPSMPTVAFRCCEGDGACRSSLARREVGGNAARLRVQAPRVVCCLCFDLCCVCAVYERWLVVN
jgi:hypothetical protein